MGGFPIGSNVLQFSLMSSSLHKIGAVLVALSIFSQTAVAATYYPSYTYPSYDYSMPFGASVVTNSNAITYVKDNRIMTGYKNGFFGENNLVNRAEFAKIIMTLYSRQVPVHYAATLPFRDTSMNAWYTPAIVYVWGNGLMQGYPDGSFRPSNPVTLVEAAKVLGAVYNFGSLNNDDDEDEWYSDYLRDLDERNAIPTNIGSLNQPLTRGQLADIIYRLDAGIRTLPSQTYNQLRDGSSNSGDVDCNDDDIGVSIDADDDTPRTGDTVELTIRVRNCTNDDQDIDLTATFDSELRFVSATDGGDDTGTTRVEWRNLNVDSDDEEEVILRLRVNSSTYSNGDLDIDVRATNEDDDTDTDSLSLDVGGSSSNNGQCYDGRYYYDCNNNSDRNVNADIIIDSVTADPDPVYGGDTIRYEIRLRNRSGADSARGTLRVQFDTDLTYVSGSSNVRISDSRGVYWDNIRLDRYDTNTYTLKLRVRDGVADRKLLQAFITMEDSQGDRDSVSRPVEARSDSSNNNGNCYYDSYGYYICPYNSNGNLSAEIRADQTNPRIGDIVHYVITVRNNRSSDDYVDVDATLDSNLTYVSSTGGGINSPNDLIKWSRIFVPRYETRTVTLDVRIAGGARVGDQLRVNTVINGAGGRSESAAYVRVNN